MTDEAPNHELPVIVAFPGPFRLVFKNRTDTWGATLEDINRLSYDYVKLNRVSGFFDGNIQPMAMMICFDGALALPAMPQYADVQTAMQLFNRVLAEQLMGGVYAEAVTPLDISVGHLLSTGYVRIFADSKGPNAQLHGALRIRSPNPTQAMTVLEPETWTVDEFVAAITRGKTVFAAVPTLSPDLLLAGATHLIRSQLSEAMIALWTSVEQIVSHLWEKRLVEEASTAAIPGRKNFLNDNRTWPISTRVEMLFQKGVISAETYRELDAARKSRNAFIHAGETPKLETVEEALSGMFRLLATCVTNGANEMELDAVKTMILKRVRRDGSSSPVKEPMEPRYWRELPLLPGEKHFKGEFEPFELNFRPISEIMEASTPSRADTPKKHKPCA